LQEAAQPPLYYLLMAGLTNRIDSSDLAEIHQVNPHAFVGDPNQIGNKNLIIHQLERETFPWRGSVLAIYVIRLASIALGFGTIVVIFLIGSHLFNIKVGLLAAAITAFNPMFLFVHAAVNNDALAIFLGNLGLFLLVLLWQDAPDPRRRWYRYAGLGLVLGLGLLTKLSLGGLLLLAGGALAWQSWRRREADVLLLGGGLLLLTALIVAAPWFVRNYRVYGDPAALGVFIEVQGSRAVPITWRGWTEEFGTFFRSFWGLFGGVNIALPEPFYAAYNLLFVVGVIGFLRWVWRGWKAPARIGVDSVKEAQAGDSESIAGHQGTLARSFVEQGIWLLIVWAGVLFALLVRWNLLSPAFQGRLIFPALGALNVLWAAGMLYWLRPSRRGRLALSLGVLTFVVALLIPWTVIRPAYAFPEPSDTIPAEARFGPISFRSGDDEIQLVGLELAPNQSVTPGNGPIEVVLYWTSAQPVSQDYLSNVHLLGRELVSVGQVDRYPGSGMVPTSRWQPGQLWRDIYHVYVNSDAVGPSRLQIRVGMFDTSLRRDLTAHGPDGEPIELVLLDEARLESPQVKISLPPGLLNVEFADNMTLRGYEQDPPGLLSGDTLRLTLFWEASGTPSQDYTVFVHFNDRNGDQLLGADGPPVYGDYATHLWRAGDQILDEHILILPDDLPPGAYQLAVGLYDPASGVRVPLLDGSGDAAQWQVIVNAEQ
jgi:4-amino-4-deoxy-L-arabinose transferase-like glycosyltransferase